MGLISPACVQQPTRSPTKRPPSGYLKNVLKKTILLTFVPLTSYRVLLGVRLKTQMSSSSTFVTPKVRDD